MTESKKFEGAKTTKRSSQRSLSLVSLSSLSEPEPKKERFIMVTLHVINLFLAVIGFVLLGLAIVLQLGYKHDFYLMGNLVQALVISYLMFGSFSLLFSLFGFVGILRKNFVFISLFLIYLFVITIGVFASGLWLFVVKSNDTFINKISLEIKSDISHFSEHHAVEHKATDFNYVSSCFLSFI